MYIIYKLKENIYIGDNMVNLKEKIIYCSVLIAFLCLGVTLGYLTSSSFKMQVDNPSLIEYAKNYAFDNFNNIAVTTATQSYDIDVIYEDNYLICNENTITTKTIYGTTMDKVKEDEQKYQEENGLVYTIKAETATRIVYTRTLNENCPNHFYIILEDGVVNIYTVKGENNNVLYMSIDDINVDNLRNELKVKIEKGTSINSKEELNRFIEDLET